MLRSRPSVALLSTLAAIATLVGCGGGEGGGSKPLTRRYEGSFSGVFTGTNGSVRLDVATDGTIVGTASDSRFGADGVVKGARESDGATTLTITYTVPGAGLVSRRSSGTLTDPNGVRLTGVLEEQGDQNPNALSYDLSLVEE